MRLMFASIALSALLLVGSAAPTPYVARAHAQSNDMVEACGRLVSRRTYNWCARNWWKRYTSFCNCTFFQMGR